MKGEERSETTINAQSLFKVMVYIDFHDGVYMQLAFTLLYQLLVMSLVLFHSHSPSHHPPASLRSALECRGGLGTRLHGLLAGPGCLGICVFEILPV